MILGIDIALRKSGYTLTTPDGNTILKKGIVLVPDKQQYTEYVATIYSQFLEIFLSIREEYGEDIVLVVESVADVFHKTAALAIHAARTAMIISWQHAHFSKDTVVYYTPSSVKYFLTNKRGAKKDELRSSIATKYPQISLEGLEEDEIDALALILRYLGEKNEQSVPVAKRKRRTRRVGS